MTKIKTHKAEHYNSLGNVCRRLSRWDEALTAYQKALEIQPDYAIAHCNIGVLYTALEQNENAILHLKKAIELNPDLLPALNQLGDIYLREEKYIEAREIFLQSVVKMPNNAESTHRLGIAYLKLRDFEHAKIQFEKVLVLNYQHPEINQYLANTWLELRDHEKALHYYFCQLERNPYVETFYNIGVLFMMKERLQDALQYFNKAAELDPNDVPTQLNMGNIYLKQHKIDHAIICYYQANALRPNDPEIQHILSALTQQKTSDAAPPEYVMHLFDQYAPYYEKHLSECLHYEVPEKILQTIQLEYPHCSEYRWNMIDLGCGTGFCGVLFKPLTKKLIGVDLSGNMLSVAREKNIYDELIEADITEALMHFNDINLIIAADVFTYIGDLAPIFSNAVNVLAAQGLFIFTVEKSTTEDYFLQTSIRYAHSKSYLDSLIAQYPFEVLRFDNIQLRKQMNKPVEGYLVLLKKQ